MEYSKDLHYSEDRDDRRKDTGEVFTPDWLVDKMLSTNGRDEAFWKKFSESDELCIDPTCGSGQFLVGYARKGVRLDQILGVDLMLDNIETCKRRLTEIFLEKGMELGDEDTPNTIIYHLNRNIICADALTYNYEFWWHNEKIYEQNQKYKIKLEKIELEKKKVEKKHIEELKKLEKETQPIDNDEW